MAPGLPGDDYDLAVYDDYSGSTSGFSNLIGGSAYGSNATDFVVGHYLGTPTQMFPAVIRWSVAGGGAPFYLDQIDAEGRNAVDCGEWLGEIIASGRLVDVYEGWLGAGKNYDFEMEETSGGTQLEFSVFPDMSRAYRRSEGTVGVLGPDGKHRITYVPVRSGWHPIVVYRTYGTQGQTAVTYDLRFCKGSVVAVEEFPEVSHSLSFAGSTPNPARGSAQLQFTLSRPGPVSLRVYDISGALVREILSGRFEAGPQRVAWDGRDSGGRKLAAGVYLARLEAEGRTLHRRIVWLD